jgi:hypothetical protein
MSVRRVIMSVHRVGMSVRRRVGMSASVPRRGRLATSVNSPRRDHLATSVRRIENRDVACLVTDMQSVCSSVRAAAPAFAPAIW